MIQTITLDCGLDISKKVDGLKESGYAAEEADKGFCISEDGVAGFHNLDPFGLGPQDDARLLEEISFLLHAA